MTHDHECKDCGAINSYHGNGDNHICTECGSTEGLHFFEDEQEDQLIKD